jgi:type IV pilus assembly protein PilA
MFNLFSKMVRNRKGFTLTELIVVVAILGVLAAVVTPMVTSKISEAKKAADNANARVMENIVRMHMASTGKTSISGAEAYEIIVDNLGELPENQSGGTFYINTSNGHVTTNPPSGETDYEEIKD